MLNMLFKLLLVSLMLVCSHTLANTETKLADIKISVQLYSVRDDVARNFEKSLSDIAQLGIDGVEFAGDFGPYKDDPEGLKDFLSQRGLQSSGAHVSFDALKGDAFAKTVDFHSKLGTPYLIIPWDERAFSTSSVDEVVNDLNDVAEKLQGSGIRVGFHNHSQELAAYNNTTFWDYIAKNTRSDVLLQLDVGWVIHAGADPVVFVSNYPSRISTSHFKSEVKDKNNTALTPLIGKDGIDWQAILMAGHHAKQFDWIVVEQEVYPNGLSPMASLSTSVAGLQSVLSLL